MVLVQFMKEASQTRVILSQRTPFDVLRLLRAGYKQFARLAQILRCAKQACSG